MNQNHLDSPKNQQEQREDERPNVYEIIKPLREGRDGEEKKKIITRLFYAAGLIDQDVISLMVLQGTFCVCLVEGTSETIKLYIEFLQEEFKNEKSVYNSLNILAYSEENPSNVFPDWHYENFEQRGPIVADIDRTDPYIAERSSEIYLKFVSLGLKIMQKCKGGIPTKQMWSEIAGEAKLPNEDLFMLVSKRFMSLNEYASLYLEDLDLILDDEISFPQPIPKSRYLEYYDTGK